MKGRKPKPTQVKKLTGNPGKRKLNEREPQPPAPELRAPDWLVNQAKKEWDRLAPLLARVKVLTQADRDALAAICQLQAQVIEATETLRKSGTILEKEIFSRKGEPLGEILVLHPANKVQMDCIKQLRSLWEQFGLTPSSRARVQTTPEQATRKDPITALRERRASRKR